MSIIRQRVAVFLGVLATCIVVACETTQLIDPETGDPVWVSVTPQTDVLRAIAASLQLQIIDQMGRPVTVTGLSWRLLDPGIVQIDQTGRVTAVAPGTARIVVESASRSDTAVIHVRQDVAGVTVSPGAQALMTGATQQLAAALRDPNGYAVGDRPVSWASSAAAVASVSSSGLVTAAAAGTATITATSEGKAGTAAVTVTATPPVPVAAVEVSPTSATVVIGQTRQLAATLRDAGGAVLTGRAVTWATSAAGVATVSGAGLVTAVGAGTATITATSEGRTGTATVTVTAAGPVAVATVGMSPTTLGLVVGQTGQLTATPRDASGAALTGRVVTWATSAAGVATVSATGLVSGVGAGTATITATSEGKTATASVTVSGTTPAPGPGVPVYSAANANHVLHVFENWSTYATISEIDTRTRVDGGGSWEGADPSVQTFSTTNNDPWFGTKTVTINLQDGPAANAAHNRGFSLTQGTGSPARYLNASTAKASLVIEWAVRQSGVALYVGKIADWNPQGAPNLWRFDFQNSYDRLGHPNVYPNCQDDPLCRLYYADADGEIPRIPGTMTEGFSDQIARSYQPNNQVWFAVQNRNQGTGPGKFDYASSFDSQLRRTSPFLDNVWRRYIIRLTLNQPGQPVGYGRVEQWIQKAGEPAVKVMEYVGDIGGFDQGLINTGPTGVGWINPAGSISWYNLTAVGQIFKGGATIHLGYFRMWSHPRE
jgi:uncharacterized protein YjdB